MFLTVHATTGVLIGQQTGNIWLAFLAGFISHFILDIIPHGDQGLIKNRHEITNDELKLIRVLGIADTICMLALMTTIYYIGLIITPLPVLFAVAGSILPDYINACYIFFKVKWLQWYFEIHYKLHFILNGFTVNLPQGLIIQIIFLISVLTVIL